MTSFCCSVQQKVLAVAPCVLLMWCLLNSSVRALDCFEPDIQALRSFAQHITRSRPAIRRWGAGNACCSWEGVTCTAANHTTMPARVSGLRLSLVNVSTSFQLQPLCNLSLLSTLSLDTPQQPGFFAPVNIPGCLGHLSALRSCSLLSLLQGPIPASFSRLLHLQHLDLSDNSALSGGLLPISSLPNLTYVDLSLCNFSGPLPPFHAPRLQFLYLIGNSFTGSIPPSIARLSNLVSLYLDGNHLSGELPHSFCNLASLTYLSLAANLALNGTLDSLTSLECMFRNLTELYLEDNFFTGPFPRWIGHSPSLQLLSLGGNKFQGPLPEEWQNLHNLWYLDLSGNSPEPSRSDLHDDSTYRLPDWIFRFRLQYFVASSCGLQTPDVLCGAKLSLLNQSLQRLDLGYNYLTGPDTLECFHLHNFSHAISLTLSGNPLSINLSKARLPLVTFSLDLSSCALQGHVPKAGWFFTVTDIPIFVSFANNSLIGSLPIQIFNSSLHFEFVDLSYNHFNAVDSPLISGPPPTFLYIDVSHNALAMNFPSFLATLGLACNGNHSYGFSYSVLDLSHNALVGEIPSSLGLCNKQLSTIKVDNNNLIGQIPEELIGLASLETLTLSNNRLKGTIPASIFAISSLTLLDLSYNELEGNLNTLFSSSSTLTDLRVVLLSHNRISGSISPSFGTFMPNLQLIDFSENQLTGIIPHELHLPYFKNLKATKTGRSMSSVISATGKLYGEIEMVVKGQELGYTYVLEVMTSLDLSGNYLQGAIPEEMGDLEGLLFLNLSHNNLSGSIPSTLAKLSQLQALDLSWNQLEGPLPTQLSDLTKLSNFNVSYNAGLWGRIPEGPQFEMEESYKGDPDLCGSPGTLKDCKPASSSDVPAKTASHQQPAISSSSCIARWIDEWIAVPGLRLGILVGFVSTICLLHFKDVKALLHSS